MNHLPVGTHLLIEYYGVNDPILNSGEALANLLTTASSTTKAKPLSSTYQDFKPNGASAIVLIEESHLSIHTYPEHGYCAIDVFTCGTKTRPYEAHLFLKEVLRPQYVLINEVQRGINK